MGGAEAGQAAETNRFVDFGPFRLDRRERLLFRGAEPIPLPPKAADLLVVLAEAPGALRTKEELIARVWPNVTVDESNLTQNIFLLRKALGDEGDRWIDTVPRRGYRFLARVTPGEVAAVAAPPNHARRALAWLIAAVVIVGAAVAVVFYMRRPSRRVDPIHSIAVLPFRPLDERRGDAPLELGIADTIINKLSELPDVVVTPTRAIARFVDHPVDALAAGRELGVDTVLEGSIQRELPRVRCNVRLLRVSDGSAIWTDHYDEQAGDLFEIEDQLAQHLADALNVRLNSAERRELAKRYTDNREAYQLYQQGRYAWSSLTREGTVSSLRFYEEALQKDPRYALAWGGIALSYMVIGIYGPVESEEAFARSKGAARRALELDPSLSIAHEALGGVLLFHDWDWDGSHAELQRAIELNPNSSAHGLLAFVLQAEGKPDLALVEARRALLSDPLWKENQRNYLLALLFARRYDDVITDGMRLIAGDPGDDEVHFNVARAMTAKGRLDDAMLQEIAALKISPQGPFAHAGAGVIAARRGDRAEARRQIEQIEKMPTTNNGRTDYYASWVYAALGDADHSFASLDAAYRARYPLLWRIRVDPEIDPIRNDPRFAQLLARMRLGGS